MSNTWDSLPNGLLLDELLELAACWKESPDTYHRQTAPAQAPPVTDRRYIGILSLTIPEEIYNGDFFEKPAMQ